MGPVASATSEGAPATRQGWRRLGAGPRPRPCSGLGQCQAPPGPSGVPWQAQGVSSRGACEARPVGRGRRGRGGGRGGGGGCGLHPRLPAHQLPSFQGDQDDRSYKQCRTSSPSSTGSVSVGRHTPTSRSPQHCSRPGTRALGLFRPRRSRTSRVPSYESLSRLRWERWLLGCGGARG